jgi:hypothetical protein
MTFNTTVSARYKNVEGWHVFQSDDLPGLYVASKDARKAFDDVALSIQTLVRLDEGIDCEVVPEKSFHEFIALVRKSGEANNQSPVVLTSKRYVLTSAEA